MLLSTATTSLACCGGSQVSWMSDHGNLKVVFTVPDCICVETCAIGLLRICCWQARSVVKAGWALLLEPQTENRDPTGNESTGSGSHVGADLLGLRPSGQPNKGILFLIILDDFVIIIFWK